MAKKKEHATKHGKKGKNNVAPFSRRIQEKKSKKGVKRARKG
jgi:hypothetical protein